MRVPLFRGTTGLNFSYDPARIVYSPDTGIKELSKAINIDIDSSGRISRRRGYTRKLSVSAHSIFAYRNTALFVTDKYLCSLAPDLTSYTAIKTVTVGARMSYCPAHDRIYYANGFETGYIGDDGLDHAWAISTTYIGPETTREFSDPPVGSVLSLYRGRMYVAQGPISWYSEPYDFSRFDLASNYLPFDSNIIMQRAVYAGIYFGIEKGVVFVSGEQSENFVFKKVSDTPPIQYTDTSVRGRLTLLEDGTPVMIPGQEEEGIMWMSKDGIFYGGPQGNVENLLREKITSLPGGVNGTGLYSGGKYYGIINP